MMEMETGIKRIERIRGMEDRMDRAARWVDAVSSALDQISAVRDDVLALSAYYESPLWRADYEADEAGELPAELKRGVLSEDGLYDLMQEYAALMERLREAGRET